VHTPQGIRYTRQGSLKMAMDGRLVTSDGFPVLAARPGGLAASLPADAGAASTAAPPEVIARYINLRDQNGPVSVSDAGEIYVGDRRIAQISVTEFNDRNQ